MNSKINKVPFSTMDEFRKYTATLPAYSGNIYPVDTMTDLKKRPYEMSTFNEYIRPLM